MLTPAVTLTACNDPAALIDKAMTKIEKPKSFEAIMKADIKMTVAGTHVEMPVEIDVAVENPNSTYPTIAAEMGTELFGEKMAQEIYCKDGWVYIISEETPTKPRTPTLLMNMTM